MKMKEKKTEEVVEEVVETTNQVIEYLEFARQCMYQYVQFENQVHAGSCFCLKGNDLILKTMGIDIRKPVDIKAGYADDYLDFAIDRLVKTWIEKYNELDLTKCDNYTRTVLCQFVPDLRNVEYLKDCVSRCEPPLAGK